MAPKIGWIGWPIGSTGEKPVIQAAYEGVERIEECMDFFERYAYAGMGGTESFMVSFEKYGQEWWENWQKRLRTNPNLLTEPKKISSDSKQ